MLKEFQAKLEQVLVMEDHNFTVVPTYTTLGKRLGDEFFIPADAQLPACLSNLFYLSEWTTSDVEHRDEYAEDFAEDAPHRQVYQSSFKADNRCYGSIPQHIQNQLVLIEP